MSEFQSDIKDKKYDEEGNELDKHDLRLRSILMDWVMFVHQ